MNSLDNLISGFVPYPINFMYSVGVNEGAATYMSLIKSTGTAGFGYVGPSFHQGSGYQVSGHSSFLGGLAIPDIEGPLYLTKFNAAASVASALILYDRLWHCTGFNCATTGFQDVTTPEPLPPRDNFGTSSGLGVEIWGEINAAPGATAGRWQVYYTNSDGVDHRTGTYLHPANAETSGQIFPFLLQGADKGVSGVSGVRLLTSSATTGNLGIVLIRRIAEASCFIANSIYGYNVFDLGMPTIYPKSNLQFITYNTAVTAMNIIGSINLASG